MKVLFATGIFPPDIGGPAIYTLRLAQEFQKRGIDVRIICYSDVEKYGNYKFRVQRVSRKYPKGIRHFLYFLNLLRLAEDVDIIYAQNVTSAGFPALLVSKILRKKLIVKIVGDYAWEEGRRRKIVKETLKEFQNKKYAFQIEFLRKIQKLAAKGADIILTPSQYLKNIVSGWGIPKEKIKVVYNAPEIVWQLEISKPEAKRRIRIEGDIILSIGRLVPWKGFSCLIEIMEELVQNNPNFKLLIIGEGEEISNLKSQISNLKLEERVRLAGKVDHSQIPLYFKAADIFVLNSEYEGLSHVILEAMQLGVPIIASNRGGNPELIENGINGFLVEYNNRNQLKKAILKLWQDKSLQNEFIENSQKKIKKFSWGNLVKRTLEVFESI